MGCCMSKPCMRKWCCGGCCNTSTESRRDDNGVANATVGVHGEGAVSIEMDQLAEEDEEEEDSINEEVRFGVVLPEQLPLTVRPPPPRNNHNNNANNAANNDRTGGTDTRPTASNKGRIPAHSYVSLQATASTLNQYQFFKLLDDKIESGPDYDANCERERKLELERLSSLLRHWETCSRSSSHPGTPNKRSLGPQAVQPVTAKQLSTALAQASKAIKQQQVSQPLQLQQQGRGMVITHHDNRAQQQQQQQQQQPQQQQQQQQMTPAIVTGNPAGRYWPPLEMVINNYDGMYEFEAPIQNQRVSPTVNQTATIIHQTYGVIGSNAPIPALLRTGFGGNVPSPPMPNQLFQFGPRNSDAISIAESNFAREYHQEMYTGSHNVGPSTNHGAPRQHFDIFNQNVMSPRARSATIVIQQSQPQINYDTYTYRPNPATNSAVAPPVPQISASAQLRFSTLVSHGTPQQMQQLQYPSAQFYGNGDITHHDSKKVVLPKEAQVKRPPKERLKHQQLMSGEVHHQSKPQGNPKAHQQLQENPQRQLPSNGPVVVAGLSGPSGSSLRQLPSNVPIAAAEASASILGRSGSGQRQLPSNGSIVGAGCIAGPSGSGADNTRNYQSSVHIPMKAAVPELSKSQNKRRKEHNIEMKKMNN